MLLGSGLIRAWEFEVALDEPMFKGSVQEGRGSGSDFAWGFALGRQVSGKTGIVGLDGWPEKAWHRWDWQCVFGGRAVAIDVAFG